MAESNLSSERKTIAQRLMEMDAHDTPAHANELMRESAVHLERVETQLNAELKWRRDNCND